MDVFKKITRVTDRFLDVYLDFYGHIPIDKNINVATRKQKLWVEQFPNTIATKALQKICDRMVA
jgi:flagellar biosynthesis protein FlhG